MGASRTAPRQAQTSVERVYTYVKQCITELSIRPGESVGDTQIAKRIGISRTPVREALRQLELEGLVVHTPRHGWSVRWLGLQDVDNIFEIKECLETMLVRQATRKVTASDKAALQKAFGVMKAATKRRDQQAFLAADATLERMLYTAAGNARAQRIVDSMNAQWNWVWQGIVSLADRMERSTDEHGAIVDRVVAGDADAAARLTLDHLASIKTLLVSVLTNFVFPLAKPLGRDSVVASPRRVKGKSLVLHLPARA